MNLMRLVVTGSVGAGKSTFVQTVGEMGSVSVEEIATDETALLKKTTTVAFDFSCVSIPPNRTLHVYGTPGQYRFDFMWDILIQKAHAYLVLVAAHRPDDFHRTRNIISFMSQRSQVPMLLGFTHMDCAGALTSTEILAALNYRISPHQPPHLTINPRNKPSVLKALAITAELASAQKKVELDPDVTSV